MKPRYETIQLIDPSDKDIAEVLNLFKGIPGRTCTAAAYLEYLNRKWASLAIFVVKKNDKIVGFTQAEAPGILDPQTAWLPFSHSTNECGHKNAQAAVRLAEDWMRGKNAKRWKMNTVRNVRAMERSWGIKRSKEVLMEKEL